MLCKGWVDKNRIADNEYRRKWMADDRKRKLELYQKHELTRRCKKYGVTVEWYKSQLEKQNNACAICLREEVAKYRETLKSLAIDHRHADGTARGLLCSACNQAVGMIEMSSGWIERAVEYLKKD